MLVFIVTQAESNVLIAGLVDTFKFHQLRINVSPLMNLSAAASGAGTAFRV